MCCKVGCRTASNQSGCRHARLAHQTVTLRLRGRAAQHRVYTFLSVATDTTACFYALLADRTGGAAIYLRDATRDPIGRHSVGLFLALIGQASHITAVEPAFAVIYAAQILDGGGEGLPGQREQVAPHVIELAIAVQSPAQGGRVPSSRRQQARMSPN